jgi:hypothetical protein
MRDRIKQILREAREPVHGNSIPDKWVDGNTRGFFESDGIKYRVIYPWNHEGNGRILMQVIPYDNEDKAIYEQYKDKGPYGQEKFYRDGTIHEWVRETGERLFNKLNYISMNVFELVEDYLHMADDGNPFDKM